MLARRELLCRACRQRRADSIAIRCSPCFSRGSGWNRLLGASNLLDFRHTPGTSRLAVGDDVISPEGSHRHYSIARGFAQRTIDFLGKPDSTITERRKYTCFLANRRLGAARSESR